MYNVLIFFYFCLFGMKTEQVITKNVNWAFLLKVLFEITQSIVVDVNYKTEYLLQGKKNF